MQSFTYSTADEFISILNQQMGYDDSVNEMVKDNLRGSKTTLKLAGAHMKLGRHTRIRNSEFKLFLPDTRNTKVVDGSSVVHHGYFLERFAENRWRFESWTIDLGCHVLNFAVIIDDDGVQISPGRINMFSMAITDLDDQSYVNQQLEAQIEESQKNADYWDVKQ